MPCKKEEDEVNSLVQCIIGPCFFVVEGYKPQDFSFFDRGWKISTTINIIQVSQVKKGRSLKGSKRSRCAPKGQQAHSPGRRPGWVEAMKCALQGQKHGYETLVF